MSKKEKVLKVAIPALLSAGVIGKNIDKCATMFGPGSKSLVLLSDTAVQCLLHASKHGDVTLCERLYMSLGGTEKGRASAAIRVEALKSWFAKMGPITAVKGKWKLKEGWKFEDFKLEEAVKQPFWTAMGPESKPFEFDNLMQIIKGLVKRAEKASEDADFKGDPTVIKSFAADVVSFAEKRAQKLTPGQMGKKDENLEIIEGAARKTA